MRKLIIVASAAVLALSVGMPAKASANLVVAGPMATVTNFVTTTVVLSQDAPAYFIQGDVVPHDIAERPVGAAPTYQPKFWTTVAAPAGAYQVQWRGDVPAGTYRFVCTVHPGSMVGTATVL